MATSSNSTTIPFHKHCQQTVCSAYGYGGQGATWGKIDGLQLDHLPEGWKNSFLLNQNNITEDLAAILTLIDQVASSIDTDDDVGSWTLKFTTNNGDEICSKRVDSETSGQTVEIGGFGRNVTLNIGGGLIKFNTMKQNTFQDD